MSTAVAKTMGGLLQKNMKSIESLLPEGMDAGRLCRMALNATIKNPALAKCKPETFLMAVMNCAETGLEPTLGQCALVPYKGEVQFQPMYKGLMELARRSGQVSMIDAHVVREGDKFEYELGFDPKLKHVPVPCNEGKMLYAYAVALMKDGSKQFVVMDEKKIRKRQKVSKAGRDDAPWKAWEEEMWRKTVLKALCGMLPQSSTQLAKAIEIDNRSEAGKPTLPDGVDLSAMEGVDLEGFAEPEGEDETPIVPPKKKGKGKTVDVPVKELEGQDTSEEDMKNTGWAEGDELPM